MADKELEDIVREFMPNARVIDSHPAGRADSLVGRKISRAPDTDALVRKYRDKYFSKSSDAPASGDLTLTEVEIQTSSRDATSKRLAKRTLLIDRKRRTVVGSSG